MRYLKTYEGFEVILPISTNKIISTYGLIMDDIEELFLKFSDMGYLIRIMPTTAVISETGLFVDIIGNFPQSKKNSIDPYSPEISLMLKTIMRNAAKLGLYVAESPKKLNDTKNDGGWSGTIRFRFKKKMKILKTYESFEYEGEIFIEKICKGWGVQVEDLEDLFVEFSDDGGKVSFSYMEVKDGVIQITIRDIWEYLNDGDWLYNPLWEKRFGRIKRQLNRMGLDMNVIAKSLNHGRYTNVRIFSMSDRKRTHSKTDIVKESFGDPIPDPEPMDVNEWDEEVNYAEEIPFNQKEKELFIALSDSISLKNKIKSMPDIGKSYLYFQLINGDLNPKLRETTPISNISIYKNDDEFYFVALWTGDGLFAERELWDGGEKLYRCDGYECWEKFLREIFAGYRELIGQTKTNESLFDVPDPELMDLDEWDKEVNYGE